MTLLLSTQGSGLLFSAVVFSPMHARDNANGTDNNNKLTANDLKVREDGADGG